MPRITTRNFFDVFARAGIALKSGVPKVNDDIQMVTVIDDFSDRLGVGGRENRSFYAGQARGVVVAAGDFGIMEAEVVNQNGIIIDNIQLPNQASDTTTGQVFVYVRDQPEALDNRNIRAPLLVSTVGAIPRTIVTIGTITNANLFDGHISGTYEISAPTLSQSVLNGFPVSQGSFLIIVDRTSRNTVIGFQWHEIPDNPRSA